MTGIVSWVKRRNCSQMSCLWLASRCGAKRSDVLVSNICASCTNSNNKNKRITLLHLCMGHSNRSQIEQMMIIGKYGMGPDGTGSTKSCVICNWLKQAKKPFIVYLVDNVEKSLYIWICVARSKLQSLATNENS